MAHSLAIFGTGGFAREVLPLARQFAARERLNVVFTQDDVTSLPAEILGTPVVALDALTGADFFTLAIGQSDVRRDLLARLGHLKPATVIAATAVIGPGVEIGEGAVFGDFTMVTASARIGRQFQCNIYSYVAHDCVIGDFVTFAPRVCCNGNVIIEDGAYIGTGAVLKQGTPDKPLRIGTGATVGMGAVVTKDVAPGAVVVGNPAKLFER